MATQQQSLQASGSPSVVALLLAITPIYLFSVQARSRLGLDNLHLGLLQVVLLLVMGHLSSFIPAGLLQRRQKRQGGTTAAPALRVAEATPPPAPTAPTSVKRRHPPRPSPSKPASRKTNDRYPIPLLDGIVARFLACTSPEHLSLLPSPPTTPSEHITLSSWKVLHEAAGLRVLQHPSTPSLYGICAEFPEVPLRNLFEVLTNVESRTKWDGMCAEAREVEEVEVDVPLDGEGQPGKVKEVRGNVVWIGMKGMALIKPKDMVLLSIASRLPPLDSTQSSLRIFCATTSFDHPSAPLRSDFNRMELGVSGFLIEEDGNGGSKIVQVTDLSGLGSWVPNAVIRKVTQSLLPKSLAKLGRAAQALNLATESKYPLEGEGWMPPLLGEAVVPSAPPSGVREHHEQEEAEEDSASSTLADSDSDTPRTGKGALPSASSTRELHSLLAQLRSVTQRLNALEASSSSVGGAGRSKGLFTSLLSGGGGVEQGQMQASYGGSMTVALTAVGGAAGAAVVLAAYKAWERRRR